ncbi:hypothetical protein AKJ35_01035 [candidate division MSBL1 archaeon SCGC-AAA833F18]|uniref:HTH arsR-type domain-containing protein n=1 Tax=candidate division MSBL1 archaeon SCGC-AAA833F18 TaxID=1698257 RepID=A0A133VSA6_9EURY|nr:hypothetical protein AKJ35_01035 [candidate division MSBL1 archaeon SCGC-AAA833F18]
MTNLKLSDNKVKVMTDWDTISFVMASQPRLRVFLELAKSENTPSKLAEELSIPLSHVSKALSELEEKNLVKCLTPNRRKMKFYQVTGKGQKLKKELRELLEDEE